MAFEASKIDAVASERKHCGLAKMIDYIKFFRVAVNTYHTYISGSRCIVVAANYEQYTHTHTWDELQ